MPWFRRQPEPAFATNTVTANAQANAPYLLPADDREIQRLGFQHFALRQALQGNYAAPIQSPRDILDVGCGTGRWCIEMALKFPEATVTGVDINTNQQLQELPHNCVIVKGNVLHGLDFPDNSFDFVHARLMIAGIPRDDWPKVIAEYMRLLRPGGWLEVVEGSPPRGNTAIDAISEWSVKFGYARGIDMNIGARIVDLFKRTYPTSSSRTIARLQRVQQRFVDIPIGPYGGRIGILMMTDTISAISTIKPGILATSIVTEAEFVAQERLLGDQFIHNPTGVVRFSITIGQRIDSH